MLRSLTLSAGCLTLALSNGCKTGAALTEDSLGAEPSLVLKIGPILPYEDRPRRPVLVGDLTGVTFTPLDTAQNVLRNAEPPLLIVGGRAGQYEDMHVTFLAETRGIEDPVFVWTGIEQTFTDGDRSFADLVFPKSLTLPHLIVVEVPSPEGRLRAELHIAQVTAGVSEAR